MTASQTDVRSGRTFAHRTLEGRERQELRIARYAYKNSDDSFPDAPSPEPQTLRR